ncbi:hypothetical protein WJX72_001672 [[Myrmecia] bisecta]|uniref:Uracil-DNA glycosylase n=1 Tax=[Myrmecia] bisecta TaxID=41462 RepID=A0AAW1PP79_9CHLO
MGQKPIEAFFTVASRKRARLADGTAGPAREAGQEVTAAAVTSTSTASHQQPDTPAPLAVHLADTTATGGHADLAQAAAPRLASFQATANRAVVGEPKPPPGAGGQEWQTQIVFPPQPFIFRALNTCPLPDVRVVILGQDPYHGMNQAMGLSFSVPPGQAVPSSLQNIYKELRDDCGCHIPNHGSLEKWASQGVLLLNASLTVRAHQANSHSKKGWEQFTEAIIRTLSKQRRGVVFLLWGRYAQQKGKVINRQAHHVLEAAHPSGLSANRGFFGCKHFSKTNRLLRQQGLEPIDWQIENVKEL